MDDFATWVLAGATIALVIATIGLAWSAHRQAQAARIQGELMRDSLAVSRELLETTRAERAAAAPLDLRPELTGHVAGRAQLNLTNASPVTAVVLCRIVVRETPDGPTLAEWDLPPGGLTLRVGGGVWFGNLPWNHTHTDATIEVRVSGHQLGGPAAEWLRQYRVGRDGCLVDLGEPLPREPTFYTF